MNKLKKHSVTKNCSEVSLFFTCFDNFNLLKTKWCPIFDNPMESQQTSNQKIFSRTDFWSPPSWPLTSKLHYWGTLSYTTLPRKLQRCSKGLVAGDKILTWCLVQSKSDTALCLIRIYMVVLPTIYLETK